MSSGARGAALSATGGATGGGAAAGDRVGAGVAATAAIGGVAARAAVTGGVAIRGETTGAAATGGGCGQGHRSRHNEWHHGGWCCDRRCCDRRCCDGWCCDGWCERSCGDRWYGRASRGGRLLDSRLRGDGFRCARSRCTGRRSGGWRRLRGLWRGSAGAGRSGVREGAFVLSHSRARVSGAALAAVGLGGCGGSLASRSSSGSMRSSVRSPPRAVTGPGFDADDAAAAGGAPALSPADGSLNAKASRGVSTGRSGSGSCVDDLGSNMCGCRTSGNPDADPARTREHANLPAHRSQSAGPRIVTPIALRPRAGAIRHRYCVTFRPGRVR